MNYLSDNLEYNNNIFFKFTISNNIFLNDCNSRCWDVANGEADVIVGDGHKSQVTNICAKGDVLYTCGIDDTVRYVSIPDMKYRYENPQITFESP